MIKLVFFILTLGLSMHTYAIEHVYRGDSRTPDKIKESGGMYPIGDMSDMSLYAHSFGEVGYDAYVSTSTSRAVATEFAGSVGSYVYVISSAPNLYSVSAGLGRFNPYPAQLEYSALGGIPWQQIVGWYALLSENNLGSFIPNPDYRNDIYATLDVSPDEDAYRLAGFPNNHRAWVEIPWMNHRPPGCGDGHRNNENTCAESVNTFAQEKKDILTSKLNGYEVLIDEPLKMKFDNDWFACIYLDGVYLSEKRDCASAPNVRYTKYGQFQFMQPGKPELPLCMRPSEGMINGKYNWDYMVTVACSSIDPYQQFKPNPISNGQSEIIIPALFNYKISMYNGSLMTSKPGYEGVKVEVQTYGHSNYFNGTEPFEDIIEIGLRYNLKSGWWYPDFNSLASAQTRKSYVYYNKSSRKLIDQSGHCLVSDERNSNHEGVEITHSALSCYLSTPSSKWNFQLSESGNKTVKIKSDSGQYLMSWHNDHQIVPIIITSKSNSLSYAVSDFTIYPKVKSSLTKYDDSDVMKIYEHAYKKGESISLVDSISDLGWFNKKMSSWKIPVGWKVIFYEGVNFTGKYYTRYDSIEYDDVISDKIKSIYIYNNYH